MNPPAFRSARALYPHRPELWEPDFLYEPMPTPADHPELDLFGLGRVQKANEAEDANVLITARVAEPSNEPPTRADLKPDPSAAEPLAARMLNEFVYCPRLFYYEQVEGVFVSNADTERGSAIHEKVDRGKGALPKAKKQSESDTPVVFHDVALCCIHLQSLAAQGFGDDCALRPIASSGAELHVFRP